MGTALDLRTIYCQSPNCPNEARSPRGAYSYCDSCRAKREAARAVAAPAPEPMGKPASAEAAVKRLVVAARALDKAQARIVAAQKELEQARRAFGVASADVQAIGRGAA